MKLHYLSVYTPNQEPRVVDLEDQEQVDALIESFPHLHESLEGFHDLRHQANDMVRYLNLHHLDAWLTD